MILQFAFSFVIRSFEAMFLLTASEVILGAAIIMGLSALVTVLLRVCSSRRYPRNAPNIPDEFGRNGQRVSLTSLQQRVLSKLRDRPPRYETRHNYEYQRREAGTRIPVLNPGASNIPPPSYENNDNNSVRIQCEKKFMKLLNLFLGPRAAASLHHHHRRQRRNSKPIIQLWWKCNKKRER